MHFLSLTSYEGGKCRVHYHWGKLVPDIFGMDTHQRILLQDITFAIPFRKASKVLTKLRRAQWLRDTANQVRCIPP